MSIRVKTKRVHGLVWWAILVASVVWILNFAAYELMVSSAYPAGVFSDSFIQWAVERQARHNGFITAGFIIGGLGMIAMLVMATKPNASKFFMDYYSATKRD